jgi:hypothetical protein
MSQPTLSRTDARELEHPLGLNESRFRHTGEQGQTQGGYFFNSSFSSQDNLPSATSLSHSTYSGSVPRSLGMQEREFAFSGMDIGTNRHNPNSQITTSTGQPFPPFTHNRHRPSSPPILQLQNIIYNHATINDRDAHIYHHAHNSTTNTPLLPVNSPLASRSTLWWGELEPWMDEEYAKQVCALMGWDPVSVKVPRPPPDPAMGQQTNNPGYCFLTFATQAQAASVLAQINSSGNNGSVAMPNSSKPFVLNWTSAIPSISPLPTSLPPGTGSAAGSLQQFPKEFSIFVGDLAPETSNSDLVAVFRNPVLGLRNDREPKFIRPFLSCKSAKIMLDPVTGISRGYGFVRCVTRFSDRYLVLMSL